MRLALEALRTLQVRLRGLPDDIAVFPTHGSGSFCGTGGHSGHETTLGHERATNPFFQTTEVMQFLARALNQQRYPAYYRDMAAINVAGPKILGLNPAPPEKLTFFAGAEYDAPGEYGAARQQPSQSNVYAWAEKHDTASAVREFSS